MKDPHGYLIIPGYDRVGTRYVPTDTPCTCRHYDEGYETKGCPRHWPRHPDSTD